jgi:hypothetical protein
MGKVKDYTSINGVLSLAKCLVRFIANKHFYLRLRLLQSQGWFVLQVLLGTIESFSGYIRK